MIVQAVITATTVLFLHACTTQGMVLQVVGDSLNNLPAWLQKPLYSCPICMCMWWGPVVIACGIVWMNWQVNSAVQMFMICMAAGGMNWIVTRVTPQNNKTCNCERKQRLNLL